MRVSRVMNAHMLVMQASHLCALLILAGVGAGLRIQVVLCSSAWLRVRPAWLAVGLWAAPMGAAGGAAALVVPMGAAGAPPASWGSESKTCRGRY